MVRYESDNLVKMIKFLKYFERIIIIVLLSMMTFVIFLGTIELGILIVQRVVDDLRPLILDISDLLNIFGFFMLILIGIELIETMKVYLVDGMVHVEIIFLVAIIAITRKVIILDTEKLEPLTIIGIAFLIFALSIGYFFLKKALNLKNED